MHSSLNPLEQDKLALKDICRKIYQSGYFKNDLLLNLNIFNIAVFRCVLDKDDNSLQFSMPVFKSMGITEKSYSCFLEGHGTYGSESSFSLKLHSDLFDTDLSINTKLLNFSFENSGVIQSSERMLIVDSDNNLSAKLHSSFLKLNFKLKPNVYRIDFNFICKNREYDLIKAYTSIPDVVLDSSDLRLISRVLKRKFNDLRLYDYSIEEIASSHKKYMEILDMMDV